MARLNCNPEMKKNDGQPGGSYVVQDKERGREKRGVWRDYVFIERVYALHGRCLLPFIAGHLVVVYVLISAQSCAQQASTRAL